MRKKKSKNKVGQIQTPQEYIIIFIAVILLFSLILIKRTHTIFAEKGYYIPITSSPQNSTNTLQMGELKFRYITFTPTPASESLTLAPSPNALGPAIATLAIQMTYNLQKSCGGFVNLGKVNCVNNTGPAAAVVRLKLNMSENYNLQCAGLAQAIAIGVGYDIGRGDANSYVRRLIPGYQWISNTPAAKMAPGDFTVWNGVGCQHIAVVTHVYGNHAFTVSEANGVNGSVDFFTYSRNGFCVLQGWQHKL